MTEDEITGIAITRKNKAQFDRLKLQAETAQGYEMTDNEFFKLLMDTVEAKT